MLQSRIALTAWLMIPVVFAAWYFGPGQDLHARDQAASHYGDAQDALEGQDWKSAAAHFQEAIDALPASDADAQASLELAKARAVIQEGDMWGGIDQLEELLVKTEDAGSELAPAVRAELASSRYFAAWLMRLEGGSAEEWKPEAEQARQHFRRLAENHSAEGDQADALRRNVEAVVRLEEMDLSELMALPLPKNCSGNCENLCKSKSKCKGGNCKNPGDARSENIKQGMGRLRAGDGGS